MNPYRSPEMDDDGMLAYWTPGNGHVRLVSEDGSLKGKVDLEGGGLEDALSAMRGFAGTLILGPMGYDRDVRRTLDRWKGRWMLVQSEFPVSAGHAVREMSALKHDGRVLSTCKARYDNLTLFRFVDPVERDAALERISSLPKREREPLEKGAGVTDVLANRDGDVREVRRYLDLFQPRLHNF